MKRKAELKSLSDTEKFAKNLLQEIDNKKDRATVVFLKGNLGAGKTTLTKYLAKHLGIKNTVISPTFILQKKYQAKSVKFKELVHIDAYRFEDPEESKVLKLEELLLKKNSLIIIEWPERLSKKIKADYKIEIRAVSENIRIIKW